MAVVRWSKERGREKDPDESGADRNKEYYFHKKLNLSDTGRFKISGEEMEGHR